MIDRFIRFTAATWSAMSGNATLKTREIRATLSGGWWWWCLIRSVKYGKKHSTQQGYILKFNQPRHRGRLAQLVAPMLNISLLPPPPTSSSHFCNNPETNRHVYATHLLRECDNCKVHPRLEMVVYILAH